MTGMQATAPRHPDLKRAISVLYVLRDNWRFETWLTQEPTTTLCLLHALAFPFHGVDITNRLLSEVHARRHEDVDCPHARPINSSRLWRTAPVSHIVRECRGAICLGKSFGEFGEVRLAGLEDG